MGIALDRGTRRYDDGRVLVGGHPRRVLRLSAPGAAAVDALQAGEATTAVIRALGRQLIDAGLAHPEPERPIVTPGVTVVIPVRDRADELDRCLSALDPRGGRAGGGTPILVVDDGSADPGALIAVCARHGASLLRRPASGGPAVARNAALEWVDSELVAFLDSDCVAPAGWVDALTGYFEDPRVAAVAPRVRSLVGRGFVGRYAAARSPLDMGEQPCAVTPGNVVSYVPTAALVVRREALGEGFDPGLRYGEDVDLVWRLLDQGHRVIYDPSVVVLHHERHVLRRTFRYGTSAAPLAARHPTRLRHVNLARPRPLALARRLHARGIPRHVALVWTVQSLEQTAVDVAHLASAYGLGVAWGKIRGLPTISGPRIP